MNSVCATHGVAGLFKIWGDYGVSKGCSKDEMVAFDCEGAILCSYVRDDGISVDVERI